MNDNATQNIVQIEDIIADTYPIATIKLLPSDIEQLIEVTFQDSYDDLDYLSFAILNLPSENQVGLISHKHSPGLGTEICINPELLSGHEYVVVEILKEAFKKLKVSPKKINWIHPTYIKKEAQKNKASSLTEKI